MWYEAVRLAEWMMARAGGWVCGRVGVGVLSQVEKLVLCRIASGGRMGRWRFAVDAWKLLKTRPVRDAGHMKEVETRRLLVSTW